MPQKFDPYYTWLGIPPEEQPPNHYRLLGVRPFESNADVISNAADQRMGFIRTFQTGANGVLSQKILNEIAAAKRCLLVAEKRAAYDQELRAQTAVESTPEAQLAVPVSVELRNQEQTPLVGDAAVATPLITGVSNSGPIAPLRIRKPAIVRRRTTGLHVLIGVGVVIVLMVGLVWMIVGKRNGTSIAGNNAVATTSAGDNGGRSSNSKGAANGGLNEAIGGNSNGTKRSENGKSPQVQTDSEPAGKSASPSSRPDEDSESQSNATNSESSNPASSQSDDSSTPSPSPTTEVNDLRARWQSSDNKSSLFWFDRLGDWWEWSANGDFRFVETARSSDFVELFDARRAITIRLYADRCDWMRGAQTNFVRLYTGRWLKADESSPIVSRAAAKNSTAKSTASSNSSPKPPPAGTGKTKAEVSVEPATVRSGFGDREGVPDDDARQEARAKLRELYRDAFERGLKKSEKIAFAEKLMVDARTVTDEVATRYEMLDTARGIATEIGNASLAMRIIDEMASEFQLDPWPARVEALRKGQELATTPELRRFVMESAFTLANDAAELDRFEIVMEGVRIVEAIGNKSRDAEVRKIVVPFSKEMTRRKKEWDQYKAAEEKFLTSPDDVAARLTVGKYLCLVKNDWEHGLPHLANGSDSLIAEAARLDIEGAQDTKRRFSAAVQWEKVADAAESTEKSLFQRRAYVLYSGVVGSLNNTERVHATNRMEALAAVAVNIHFAKPIKVSSGAAVDVFTGLVGRVTAAGKDLGLLVKYEPGTKIQIGQVEKFLRDQGITDWSTVVVELNGFVSFPDQAQLAIRQEVKQNTVGFALSLGGKLVDQSRPKERIKSRTVPVIKGDHAVSWILTGAWEASQLRLTQPTTNTRVDCYYTKELLEKTRKGTGKGPGKLDTRREINLSEP